MLLLLPLKNITKSWWVYFGYFQLVWKIPVLNYLFIMWVTGNLMFWIVSFNNLVEMSSWPVLNFGYILFVASITWLVLTGSRNIIYLWIFKQSLKLLLDFGIIKSLADQQYLNGTSYVVYHCIWPEMLSIVGCIDGTSHESYRPLVEDPSPVLFRSRGVPLLPHHCNYHHR
jgi:hypothetical protein